MKKVSKSKIRKDITDKLSPEDFAELVSMVKEPFGHETESYEDFIKATEKWRKI